MDLRIRFHETCSEMGGAAYMPGVNKLPMARMCASTDEQANVRVYRHVAQKCASLARARC